MKFSLSELMAKITGLEARAEAAFKAELESLKATVSTTLTQLSADIATAQQKIIAFGGQVTDLTNQNTTLKQDSDLLAGQFSTFNTLLSDACFNANLFVELQGVDGKALAADAPEADKKAALLALPLADKFKAYQGSLNAAFAKAGLPNTTLPGAPVTATGTNSAGNKMTRDQFFKLSPAAQLEFSKNGGQVTD